MNDQDVLSSLLGDSSLACQALQMQGRHTNILRALLANRKCPVNGLDDITIEALIAHIAQMDSNNFIGKCGVGEREGRVFSRIVRRRHFNLSHGIGRSGDIGAVQPKAAGSSLLVKIAHFIMLDVLRKAGMSELKICLILPVATGMALALSLLTLKAVMNNTEARYVVWPRIDQKTCLKAIFTAGLIPIVVENCIVDDEVRTDVAGIKRAICEVGAEHVVCVCSTSSCFAPRAPDRLVEISRLCESLSVAHVINNAYGVQSSSTCQYIQTAARRGRVDIVVQSTDKNFLVPVGGSVVAGFQSDIIQRISTNYPGRASIAPVFDVCVTLLSMGSNGYESLRCQREKLFNYFREGLSNTAEELGERLLCTTNNPISLAMTLSTFVVSKELSPTRFGSMLFSRNCSGGRAVSCDVDKTINGITFSHYGAHSNDFAIPYLACACAIGIQQCDIDKFLDTLRTTAMEFRKQRNLRHSTTC